MRRLSIRVFLEAVSANGVLVLLWVLGCSLGITGYIQIYPTIYKNLPNLTSILAGVIEFPASIYFFVLMIRQAFPSGIQESLLSSQQLPFVKRMRDFPVFFALGVFAGLAANGLAVIIVNIIRLSS
jgi:hypothetical protein